MKISYDIWEGRDCRFTRSKEFSKAVAEERAMKKGKGVWVREGRPVASRGKKKCTHLTLRVTIREVER